MSITNATNQASALPDFASAGSTRLARPRRPRWQVPEVIQTSATDCGPAVLEALLTGFRIPVDRGRLREACHTSIDGTSINTLESVGRLFGLAATQVVMPPENLLTCAGSSLPAVTVVQRAGVGNHFVLVWRKIGDFIQIMDPAMGRRWVRFSEFEPTMYRHRAEISARDWLDFACTDGFVKPLVRRLRASGVSHRVARRLIAGAQAGNNWLFWGALDAVARLLASLRSSGLVAKTRTIDAMVKRLVKGALAPDASRYEAIPSEYWTVLGEHRTSPVLLTNGVLVVTVPTATRRLACGTNTAAPSQPPLSRELAAVVGPTHAPSIPSQLAGFLASERKFQYGLAALGVLVGAAATVAQAVFLRHLFELTQDLGLGSQRLAAVAFLVILLTILAFLDYGLVRLIARLGRVLETHLRAAFLAKLPRLEDKYFSSRLASDLAERGHTLHVVREIPQMFYTGFRVLSSMTLMAAGIAWLAESLLGPTLALIALTLWVPLLCGRALADRDMRARTHLAGLSRHHLDALLGASPLRTHAADDALRAEHDVLLGTWVGAGISLVRSTVVMHSLQLLFATGLCIAIMLRHQFDQGEGGAMLLLAYWVVSLPELAGQFADTVKQYPACRNVALRCLEPLGAPESPEGGEQIHGEPGQREPSKRGFSVGLRDVTVEAAGHEILGHVDLDIAPGAHVAVVGSSGAGKSTLLGLLQGWHQPARGSVHIEGRPMASLDKDWLRQEIAWVDPAIQIWNGTLLSNLLYGNDGTCGDEVGRALHRADLGDLVARLPEGLQCPTGQSGGRLSGGEGQRVRLARALLHRQPRLVLLDEPFRGLDRPQRRELLARARAHWNRATIVCVTHDVADTADFDQIVVVEDGRIVESDRPGQLLRNAHSRYAQLFAADKNSAPRMRQAADWQVLRVGGGEVALS